MQEIKKIISKIFVLVLDILLFAFRILKQIVLPGKKRKGNILSSLFVFFVGTIERLFPFEHGFFKMAAIFKLKYLRQGVIIIGALLFLLSSFEWAGGSGGSNDPASYSKNLTQAFEKRIKVSVKKQTAFYSNFVFLKNENSVYLNLFHNSVSSSSLTVVLLLTTSLRI